MRCCRVVVKPSSDSYMVDWLARLNRGPAARARAEAAEEGACRQRLPAEGWRGFEPGPGRKPAQPAHLAHPGPPPSPSLPLQNPHLISCHILWSRDARFPARTSASVPLPNPPSVTPWLLARRPLRHNPAITVTHTHTLVPPPPPLPFGPSCAKGTQPTNPTHRASRHAMIIWTR